MSHPGKIRGSCTAPSKSPAPSRNSETAKVSMRAAFEGEGLEGCPRSDCPHAIARRSHPAGSTLPLVFCKAFTPSDRRITGRTTLDIQCSRLRKTTTRLHWDRAASGLCLFGAYPKQACRLLQQSACRQVLKMTSWMPIPSQPPRPDMPTGKAPPRSPKPWESPVRPFTVTCPPAIPEPCRPNGFLSANRCSATSIRPLFWASYKMMATS